jgi:hypothetical protein
MKAGGLFAKGVDGHLNSDTWNVAMPAWDAGYELGAYAIEHSEYRVTRSDQWFTKTIQLAHGRSECDTCSESVTINGVDLSSMDWSFSRTIGTVQRYIVDPPAPPTPH